MQSNGILVVGSANMDLVVMAERFPQPGETVFGNRFEMFPGGKGANQAVAAAKLGAETYFVGKMGNDEFHAILSSNMKKEGVNCKHLLVDQKFRTGTALISINAQGENEIIVISGSNMNLNPDDIETHRKLFSEIKIVLTQLEIPVDTIIRTAQLTKAAGKIFILNPAPARDLPDDLFAIIDFLTPNQKELEHLSGERIDDLESAERGARRLLERGVGNVIITLGAQGAFLINSSECRIFPARKVKPIDTTAAGDAFNGALAYALSIDQPLKQAIVFANTVAAFSVTRLGAQSSMPSMEELMKFNPAINFQEEEII